MEPTIATATNLGLWWKKPGKLQVFMAVLVWAVFFVTFIDDENVAASSTAALVLVWVVGLLVASLALVDLVVHDLTKQGMSKKAIWLSYAAEFIIIIIILVPMLIVILR